VLGCALQVDGGISIGRLSKVGTNVVSSAVDAAREFYSEKIITLIVAPVLACVTVDIPCIGQ